MDIEGINKRIEEVAIFKGFDVKQMASVLSVSTQSVYNIYSKKTTPAIETVASLLENINDISASWIITGKGDMQDLDASGYKKNEGVLINPDNSKNYICPECQKKQIEINELKEKCDLQRKLLFEYESKLPKNGQAHFG